MTPSRIHITGNAGSGKTTLANRLGVELGLPVFSLDAVVWQRGWKKTPQPMRVLAEEQLVSAPTWIIEGVSSRARRAADLVVFLDVPLPVCFTRAIGRTARHLRQQRPEFPPGCPEWQVFPKLLQIIWSFPKHAGLDIRSEAAEYPERFRVIRRGIDIDRVVKDWLAV